jgi:rRNA-processing protein FCF1
MVKLTVYWVTKDPEIKKRIRDRFGIPFGMTVNGETNASIKEEDMPLLEETARRNFIQIRFKPKK